MRDKKTGSRIKDNPSAKMMSDILPLIRLAKLFTGFTKRLGIANESLEGIHQTAENILQQSDVLTLPDRFNDAFANKGWIATGSMSVDTMKRALEFYEAGEGQQAEDEIIAWFRKDTINLLAIVRTKRFNKASVMSHNKSRV